MPCHGVNKKGQPCRKPCKGDWCQMHQNQEGDGLWDDVKSFVGNRIKSAISKGPRTSASTRLAKFLDSHEGNKVVKVQLGRKPIVPLVHKAMDVISRGRFSKAQKKLDYDKVYHNFILVTLDNGKTYKLEKNETIVEKTASKSDYENEVWDIPMNGRTDLTMKSMMDTAAKGNETRFFKYRADSDNCQRFTRDMIEKNGLMPADNPKHMEIQDADTLTKAMPGGSFIPNLVTDMASIGDRALYGDGLQSNVRRFQLLQQYL
jgi:hypothetical protein